MLHENPLMADIDVNHWRNMQSLLLQSAKSKRRIVLIHENGELLKFVHSDQVEIVKNITNVDNPREVAQKVYEDNPGLADFVFVVERRAAEKYFFQVQDAWSAAEDLDVYVHRMFALLDEYPDGIVTYPGSARTNLGLQWKFGSKYEDVQSAVEKFIPVNTSIVLAIFDGEDLWGSLVLSFDEDKRITNLTTLDPTELKNTKNMKICAPEIVNWVSNKYSVCSLGLFIDLENAKAFIANSDKKLELSKAATQGKLIVEPIPVELSQMLAL